MESPQPIELGCTGYRPFIHSHTPSPSFLSTAIYLRVLKPSLWADDDPKAPQHTLRVSLGLHIQKRYLIIAQQAVDGDEVCLRFPIALSDLSCSTPCTKNAFKLIIEARNVIRHEIVYSDTTGSQFEREIERGLIHLNCTLSMKDLERGTKLVWEQ